MLVFIFSVYTSRVKKYIGNHNSKTSGTIDKVTRITIKNITGSNNRQYERGEAMVWKRKVQRKRKIFGYRLDV